MLSTHITQTVEDIARYVAEGHHVEPDPGPDTAQALGHLVIAYGETLAREIQKCLQTIQTQGVSDAMAGERILERWHDVDQVFSDQLIPVLGRRTLQASP